MEVTDDVSIEEKLGEPLKLTLGEYTSLKITPPKDMDVAEALLEDRAVLRAVELKLRKVVFTVSFGCENKVKFSSLGDDKGTNN